MASSEAGIEFEQTGPRSAVQTGDNKLGASVMGDRVGDVDNIAERLSVRGNEADGLGSELIRDGRAGDRFRLAFLSRNAHQVGQSGAVDVIDPLAVRRADGVGVKVSVAQLLGGSAIGGGAPDVDP